MKKITPFKLSTAARKELEARKKEGVPFVQSVENALLGKEKFNPAIEQEITDYQAQYGCSRQKAIEAMLIEAMVAKKSDTVSDALAGGAVEGFDKAKQAQKPESST